MYFLYKSDATCFYSGSVALAASLPYTKGFPTCYNSLSVMGNPITPFALLGATPEGLLQRASLPISKTIGRSQDISHADDKAFCTSLCPVAFLDDGIIFMPYIFSLWHHIDA